MLQLGGWGLWQLPSPQHLCASKGRGERDKGGGFLPARVDILLHSSVAHNVVFALSTLSVSRPVLQALCNHVVEYNHLSSQFHFQALPTLSLRVQQGEPGNEAIKQLHTWEYLYTGGIEPWDHIYHQCDCQHQQWRRTCNQCQRYNHIQGLVQSVNKNFKQYKMKDSEGF